MSEASYLLPVNGSSCFTTDMHNELLVNSL